MKTTQLKKPSARIYQRAKMSLLEDITYTLFLSFTQLFVQVWLQVSVLSVTWMSPGELNHCM